jgi:hypothetical protein
VKVLIASDLVGWGQPIRHSSFSPGDPVKPIGEESSHFYASVPSPIGLFARRFRRRLANGASRVGYSSRHMSTSRQSRISYSPTIALTEDRLRRPTSSLAHADECGQLQEAGRICLLRVERLGEPVMANDHYIVMTVECSRCKTKQKVHVNTRPEVPPKFSDQMVPCIQCKNPFKAAVPDKIIRGPFPV